MTTVSDEYPVAWVSLNPVSNTIDVYPAVIAERIESAFSAGKTMCVLGRDFFNGTVNFDAAGIHSQTTLVQTLGRIGIKPAGYRNVERV
jgi:hypothetical protein